MFDAVKDAVSGNPFLAGAVVPLGLGFAFALLSRMAAGPRRGAYAMLGALLAFLIAYVLIEGLPVLPAVTAKQKLFWLALIGGVAGLTIAFWTQARLLEWLLLVLLPAAGLLWFGERQWFRGPESGFVMQSAIVWCVGTAALLRLRKTDADGQGFAAGAQLVVAAVALSIVALLGASASLATLAAALAAGLGGVLLLEYGVFLVSGTSAGLGPVGRIGVAGTLIHLAAVLVLFTEGVSLIALALIALVFLSNQIPLPFGRPTGALMRIAEPMWVTILAIIPAAFAVGVALLQADLTGYP